MTWHGGFFDEGEWDKRRATLHHNDFHHRFYQYLGASGSSAEDISVKGITAKLSGEATGMPEAAAKAFRHWPKISSNLHDLFNRAPTEATSDDMVALARLALGAVEENHYPAELAQMVRDEAYAVLARSAEANHERIAGAIAEPMRLLESIDGFIRCAQRPGNALQVAEAEAQTRQFLQWCRQLDLALSSIPVRLREGASASAGGY